MANLTPTPEENADVWQWDGETPLAGGSPTAPMNRQAQALLNRLAWLKNRIAEAFDAIADALSDAAGFANTAESNAKNASLGFAQTLQNMLASRTFNFTYYNLTGRAIVVHVNILWSSGSGSARLVCGGINTDGPAIFGVNQTSQVTIIVPPGGSYILNGTASLGYVIIGWNEMR